MIKRYLKILLALTLFFALSIQAQAAEENNYTDSENLYKEQFEASGADKLAEYLDKNTREYLRDIGCEEPDYNGILDFSLKSVIDVLFKMLRLNISSPLKGCLTACAAVMAVSVCSAFFPDDEKTKGVLNLICGSFVLISVFIPATDALRTGVSAMKLCAGFEKMLIPVLAAVLTVSGNPIAALSYQGAAFAAAQTVEAFAQDFALPLVMISGALGAVGSFLPTLRLSAVSDMLRKSVQTCVGVVSGLFTGFIAIKKVIGTSADGMAAKGVKLVTSTFVPVIGGALSEAYSSMTAGLSLLRSTVGIYGIIAVAAICLPSIISLALWVLAMRVSAMVSELLGNFQCAEILKNISFMFSMLNVILIFSAAVFVISSGTVAAIKAGG